MRAKRYCTICYSGTVHYVRFYSMHCCYLCSDLLYRCAYALLLAGVKYVVYGCRNERFGGCGSVLPIYRGTQNSTAFLNHYRLSFNALNRDSLNIPITPTEKHGLICMPFVMKEEAIQILKQFYETGNPNGTFT